MLKTTIMLLIAAPILFSFLFLALGKSLYKFLAWAFFIVGAVSSIMLVLDGTGKVEVAGSSFALLENIVLILEVLIILFVFYVSAKHKSWPTLALIAIQTVIAAYSYMTIAKVESVSFNIDQFSQVMILIVNIIGTAIIFICNRIHGSL